MGWPGLMGHTAGVVSYLLTAEWLGVWVYPDTPLLSSALYINIVLTSFFFLFFFLFFFCFAVTDFEVCQVKPAVRISC